MIKKFSIPGYFYCAPQIETLEKYYDAFPQFFYPDRIIDSSYDFPPGLIWNGGRYQPFHNFDATYIRTVFGYYKTNSKIKIRHTCTNSCIDDSMLNDWQSNLWLNINEREGNGVIIASDLLKNYIKEHYPKYNIINSTTLNIIDLDIINQLSKHELTVLNYNKNNDNEYLKQLIHPENIEILCAEPCIPNCQYRKDHYNQTDLMQLWLNFDFDLFNYCPYRDIISHNFYDRQKFATAISNDRIDELANMGFVNFKLSGRCLKPHSWYEIMIYYLVLPEHKDRVRQDLLNLEYETSNLEHIKRVTQ